VSLGPFGCQRLQEPVFRNYQIIRRPAIPSALIKILFLYDFQTGNVEQMTNRVAEGAREIEDVEVRIRKIAGDGEAKAAREDMLWADGVAVGTPA
jgi:flavorubredoxin